MSYYRQQAKKLRAFLFCALLWGVISCKESIVHNVTEYEANKFISKLIENGLESEKSQSADGTWAVSVSADAASSAIRLLSNARLLRADRKAEPARATFISSREEQKQSAERALSSEIETTLLSFAGVVEARVHLNIPNIDSIQLNRIAATPKATGSVLLIIDTETGPSKDEIANLVSGASGVPKEQIAVIINKLGAGETSSVAQEQLALQLSADQQHYIPLGIACLALGAILLGIYFKLRKHKSLAGGLK